MKKLNLLGQLLMVTLLASLSGLFTSCSDDEVINALNPPYELKNEFMYNETIEKVGSVVWEKDQETELYTFYITPQKGLQYVDDVLKSDHVKLEVDNPNGVIDPETNVYGIHYKGIAIGSATRDEQIAQGPQFRKFVVELNEVSGNLNLEVIFGMAESTECLNITFDGNKENGVTKATLPMLVNEWQYKKDFSSIGSVVEKIFDNHKDIYLISKKGVTEVPAEGVDYQYMKISLADSLKGQVELTPANAQACEITLGEVSNSKATSVEGNLSVTAEGNKMEVKLESVLDGKLLRAVWSGAYSAIYDSKNSMTVTPHNMEAQQVNVQTVLTQEINGSKFLYIGTNQEGKTLAEMAQGYLVQLNLLPENLGQDIDLATSNVFGLKVYDYDKMKTFDSAKTTEFSKLTGTLSTKLDPTGSGKIYIRLQADFDYGVNIDLDWYGELTATEEQIDLTPMPQVPYMMIKNPAGDIVKVVKLTELLLKDVSYYNANETGAFFETGKAFIFKNEKTQPDEDLNPTGYSISNTTPMLIVSTSYLNKADVDITQLLPEVDYQSPGIFDFKYQDADFSMGGGYSSPSTYVKKTTKKGTMTTQLDGDEWYVKFEIEDKYVNYDWSGNPTGEGGTGNVLTIEWRGPVTK